MNATISVEIIAVGNELLIGDVVDTNSNWLCKRLTGLGGWVRRTTTIRDDVEAIATELRAALQRGTQLVLTTGGLGPTYDDLTLAGIARALGRSLEPHAGALTTIEQHYAALAKTGFTDDGQMTESRRKMAILPQGATPLFNPIGGAPAALIREGEATIVALPGVPPEMKGIFDGPLQPILADLFGQKAYVEAALIAECPDESIMASQLSRVASQHPHVYIKSRAMWFGPKLKILVTFSLTGRCQEEVKAAANEAMADLRRELAQAGIAASVPDAEPWSATGNEATSNGSTRLP